MSATKERIDILLVEQGFFESREKAKASLMAGLVFADEERIEKPGTKLSREAKITVKGAIHPYVSRGGLKLEKALRFFCDLCAGCSYARYRCLNGRVYRLCFAERCNPCNCN